MPKSRDTPDVRSAAKEFGDNLALDEPALIANLREMETVNRWFGGKAALLSALDKVHEKHRSLLESRKIVIADLGCGGGDLLRAVHEWATDRRIDTRLIGIDANPLAVSYAAERAQRFGNIEFVCLNVLSDALHEMRFDIVCLNAFCHHLSDPEILTLLERLARQTSIAIIVNDLHRHWIPYVSIRCLSRILNFSYLGRHDGPLSVLRSFRRHELVGLFGRSPVASFEIHWRWAFRWQAVLWQA